MRIASYAALGVGVLGVGAGVFFGLQSRSYRSDGDGVCGGSDCTSQPDPAAAQARAQGLYDDAGAAQTFSIIGFVAGGVGLAVGVPLFFLSSGSSAEDTAQRGGHVAVFAGPSSMSVRGAF